MDKNYFSKYYELERNHWWFTVREKIITDAIRKRIRLPKIPSILNAGVATGRSTELLQQFGTVTSVEQDADTCAFLEEQLQIPVTCASVTDLPFFDDSFDMVCAFDVIEHVQEDASAIRQLRRVLRKDGRLILTVPAYNFLWSTHDNVNHHFRRYTADRIEKLLKKEGLSVEYLTYFNTFLFIPIASYRLATRRGKKINSPESASQKTIQSDFERPVSKNRFLNRLFEIIFSAERKLLKSVKMPFGVSMLVIAHKEDHSAAVQ
ncbi:MAG TPA: methyltransferase domain-containing protein [Flavitalea sp.]|nr:methyltransferase domain-containing protein [Flavitalea sp.]